MNVYIVRDLVPGFVMLYFREGIDGTVLQGQIPISLSDQIRIAKGCQDVGWSLGQLGGLFGCNPDGEYGGVLSNTFYVYNNEQTDPPPWIRQKYPNEYARALFYFPGFPYYPGL